MSPDGNLDQLQSRLHYRFSDTGWLQRALIHTSYAYEHGLDISNERLELLGDAVLHLVLTEYLMRTHPSDSEGHLSALRSYCESAPFLHDMAVRLDLGCCLLLGKGEQVSGGRDKQSLLADALEAIIAAIYKDGGYAAAETFILTHFTEKIHEACDEALYIDSKTELQKITQKRYFLLPVYTVEGEDGLEHEKIFTVRVDVQTPEGILTERGKGRNKKLAEKAAARNILKQLL